MKFPIFLKHSDSTVFYQIHSDDSFRELKRIGPARTNSRFLQTVIEDGDFSIRVYIRDLIESAEKGQVLFISQEEFVQASLSVV